MRPLIALLLVPALAIGGCDRQSQSPPQANAVAAEDVANALPPANAAAPAPAEEAAPSPSPSPSGSAAPALIGPGKLDRSHKGASAPAAAFTAPDGAQVTLADFRGKPLLLNLWATWCAPCVKELPTLDALAGSLKGKVQVLAVSQDIKGAEKVGPFWEGRNFANLKPYLDPKVLLSSAITPELPVTVLYDSKGKEVWRMVGDTEWNSAAAKALVAEAK